LKKLAQSLNMSDEILPFEISNKLLEQFDSIYEKKLYEKFAKKLGLDEVKTDDPKLISEMFEMMNLTAVDFTNFFRHLTLVNEGEDDIQSCLKYMLTQVASPVRMSKMVFINPDISLERLEDLKELKDKNEILYTNQFPEEARIYLDTQFKLLEKITNFTNMKESDKKKSDEIQFTNWLLRYVKRLKEQKTERTVRITSMNKVNAKFVLRNYLADKAIQKAERGNFDEVNNLLKLLQNPFDENEQFRNNNYDKVSPDEFESCLSCSS